VIAGNLSRTFRSSEEANLDKGAMCRTSFALKESTAAGEAKIAALAKKAVSQGPSYYVP
jgi:hypothetical protein